MELVLGSAGGSPQGCEWPEGRCRCGVLGGKRGDAGLAVAGKMVA